MPNWTIGSVAILYKGYHWILDKPARHHDVIAFIHQKTEDIDIQGEQGFIAYYPSTLTEPVEMFVNREDAAKLAYAAGQIPEPKNELFSEDLW